MTATLCDYALHALGLGLAVVPPAEAGTKRPEGSWKRYQVDRPTPAEVEAWYADGRSGFGVVLGRVSGGLEMLELEGRAVAGGLDSRLMAEAGCRGLHEVLDRVVNGYGERTPSGGIHLLWRCAEVEGNQRLAVDEDGQVLIETRGEGGYVILAPSAGTVHPTGKPWVLVKGGLDTIASVTPDERRQLLDLCRSLDRRPAQPPPGTLAVTTPDAGGRPGDQFDLSGEEVLKRAGFTFHSNTTEGRHFTRPGKDVRAGSSATVWTRDGRTTLFSTSIDAPDEVVTGHRRLTPFQLHTHLEHMGDFTAAARAWRLKHPRPHDDLSWAITTPDAPPANIDPDTGEELVDERPPIELDEFLALDEPEHDWLVEGLLERGDRAIMTAAEGGGKSTLLRQLGVQLAAGVHPFTLDPIPPVRVLLVDLENSRRHIRRKLRALREIANDYQAPGFRLECRPEGLDLLHTADATWLAERCRTAAAEVLIIGPLYKLAAGDPTREETARPVALALDAIRTDQGLAVLLEAHTPYADGSKAKRPERPYGASLWSRWPEFGIFLADDGTLRHWRGQRDERTWPAKLKRGEPWPWMVKEATAPTEEWHGPTHAMEAIVDLLRAETDELSTTALINRLRARGLGFRRQTIIDAAEILVNQGLIVARTGPRQARIYSANSGRQETLDATP